MEVPALPTSHNIGPPAHATVGILCPACGIGNAARGLDNKLANGTLGRKRRLSILINMDQALKHCRQMIQNLASFGGHKRSLVRSATLWYDTWGQKLFAATEGGH